MPRDPDDPYVRTIVGGRATAPSWQHLFTFVHLIGTPWSPVFDGAILMLEEVNEPPHVMEVHLHQLQLAGKLEGLAGMVVGELKNCDWRVDRPETPRTRSIEDVLERCLAPIGVPTIYKLPSDTGNTWPPSRLGCKRPWTPKSRRSPSTNPASSPRRRYVRKT